MASSFHRITQTLHKDNGLKSKITLSVTLLLLSAWLTWAFKAPVTRYEASDSARLEINSSGYPVQANLAGRLVASRLVLGGMVRAGDVIAELDSGEEQLSLQEEIARQASVRPQLAALEAQSRSEEAGVGDERRVAGFSEDAASAQYRQAEAQAALAEGEARRAERLRSEGILAEAEAEKAQADARSKRAAAESLKVAISRLGPELQVRERDREVRIRQIAADKAKLAAQISTSEATIRRLEYEVERRRIRAPISGRLAECAVLPPGSHLSEGQQLGVILPSGDVQVIADFQPSAAFGKVRPDQPATVRLQGFPWAQYGTVAARVSRVASEVRNGKVRVELALSSAAHSRIPFQHGLPGTVEVEVERTTPATLLLRSVGSLVGAP
jgi:multidrug resistance efflux pump